MVVVVVVVVVAVVVAAVVAVVVPVAISRDYLQKPSLFEWQSIAVESASGSRGCRQQSSTGRGGFEDEARKKNIHMYICTQICT